MSLRAIMYIAAVSLLAGMGQNDIAAPGTMIENAADSCFKLEAYDEYDNKLLVGSGFVMIEENLLFTCWHNVSEASYLIVTNDDGESFSVDDRIAFDEERDLAVYQLPKNARTEVLEAKKSIGNRGDEIYAIASFGGITNIVSEGIISGSWSSQGIDFLLFSAPIAPGCSGGALIDENGNAAGMICRSYEEAQSLNFAIPADDIVEFYNSFANTDK